MAVKKSRKEDEPNKQNGEQEEEKISLTPSQLSDLIDSKIAAATGGAQVGQSNAELVKMLADAINKKDYEIPDDFGYTDPADLDPKDVLEDPVIFWAPGFHVVIGDDTKHGRKIPPPVNRVIWFKPEGSKRVQNGKEMDIQIFSKYACYSKKEKDWLEKHTLYGIAFFLEGSSTMNVDLRFTQKLMEYANGLRNMEGHRVVKEAQALGMAFTNDLNELRLALAHHKTKEYMKQFDQHQADILQKTKDAEDLLKS